MFDPPEFMNSSSKPQQVTPKRQSGDPAGWLVLPGYVLLFLMLVFPMVLQVLYVKAFLFGFLMIVVMVGGLTGRFTLHPIVVLWTYFFSIVGFFFVLRGLLAGTPGAAHAAQLYVIWPIIYVVVLAGVASRGILVGLQRTLVAATLCIAIQGGVYLLTQVNILPENRYTSSLSLGWEDQSIGFHEGYIGMQFPGLNSLPFLLPFIMAALVTQFPKTKFRIVPRFALWISLFLGLTLVLTSGRRAVMLVTAVAPILILAFTSLLPSGSRHLSRKSLARLTAALVLTLLILPIPMNSIFEGSAMGIFDRLSSGFDFTPTTIDEGAAARSDQYTALVRGWYENPILGAGHGASAYGSIRSETRPWEYELSYLALLFQTGILGFLVYAAGVVWIYWTGTKMIREGGPGGAEIVPLLVGMSCYLIANATNPYLARFDGIWAIFLPLAFINYWLLSRDQARNDSGGHIRQLREQS
ncbi:MAG TPA: hypothetical protein VNX66_06960 [Candidatus Sulfotelmatobacter sp.]|nr:hypothetical protein [Candidatus Sulfotelmatobacter sp.]